MSLSSFYRITGLLLIAVSGLRANYETQVTGSTSGTVWGSGPYTSDSSLGTAAVHAGLISSGQSATIRVIELGSQSGFSGSTSNGVTTSSWSSSWSAIDLELVSGGGGSGGNSAPSASISGPSSLAPGQSGSWNFSASDSNSNLYRWRVSLAPNSAQWSYISGGSQSSSFNHSFSNPGNYTFILEVEDTNGATASDSVAINVNASNHPPEASLSFSANPIGTASNLATTASASDADSDSGRYLNSMGVRWLNHDLIAWWAVSGTSASRTHNVTTPSTPGTEYFRGEAWDNASAGSAGDWQALVVVGTSNPSLAVLPVAPRLGETVTVTYAGAADATTWIGLFAVGASNSSYVASGYVPNSGAGTKTFTLSGGFQVGQNYEARLFPANGTTPVATSNTFTVAPANPTYSLVVLGGTGNATGLSSGTVRTIVATPPSGQTFVYWSMYGAGNGTIGNALSSTTTFTIGTTDGAVQAVYNVPPPTYLLTVNGGTATPAGPQPAGAPITISATPGAGQTFTSWTHSAGPGTLSSSTQSSTTFVLGAGPATVTANYGSTSGTSIAVSASTNNYNLATALGNPTAPVTVTVTINAGVVIGSNSPGSPAFTTGNLPAGSAIMIVNRGRIQGAGGRGGDAGQDGQGGGDAIVLTRPVAIDNSAGQIWGGGGGGGGEGEEYDSGDYTSNAGGGGAGTVPGAGGSSDGPYHDGSPGTWQYGGNGGARGGDPGEPGEGGEDEETEGGDGGAAGAAVKANGHAVTWFGGGSAPNLRGAGGGANTVPQPPATVTATNNLSDKIAVNWSAAVGATGYDIYRHTANNPAAATKLNGSALAALSYNDTTPVVGLTYFYWIKAKTSIGDSAFSAAVIGVRIPPAGGGGGAFSAVIASHAFNYNLATALGNPSVPVTATVTINLGVVVGSNSPGSPAFTTGNLPAGSSILIVNHGRIQGAGGRGGDEQDDGQNGGDAIALTLPVTINNTGQIWGGGGGGGGEGSESSDGEYTSNAGGGGAGTQPGAGGNGQDESFNGNGGTWQFGGSGGAYGGNPGEPGEDGEDEETEGGRGGAAGAAVRTNGHAVTWLGGGLDPNVKGAGGGSNSVPLPPVTVAATNNLTDKIAVSWAAVLAVTGYDIYRHTANSPAAATKLNGAVISTLSYDDVPPVAGTTYYYWVKAKNGTGDSAFSTVATGLRVAPAPAITSPLAAGGSVGAAFSYAVTATNSPTSFAASGLPAGLSVNTTTGAISGTPTGTGTFSIGLSATNVGGTGNATLSLNIAKANQTISFGALANKTQGDPPFTVSASASSGLAVTFSVVSGPATISGSTVTLTGTGTVTIRAAQAGNANYNPAANVDQSFIVQATGAQPDTTNQNQLNIHLPTP